VASEDWCKQVQAWAPVVTVVGGCGGDEDHLELCTVHALMSPGHYPRLGVLGLR
jgi:hypothetical protein